jgi:hypothetical protein
LALNTIIRAIIAVFGLGLIVYIFMPAVSDLYYNQEGLWSTAPAEMLQTRDNIYTLLTATPLLAIGVIFIWSYVSTQSKEGY